MSYFCNICKKHISDEEYSYSKEHFDKALCRSHQKVKKMYIPKKPSKEAYRLGMALKARGCPIEFEKFDGFKHIDIAIVEAKVNIEVDGAQHNYSDIQALADLKRTIHSFRKGYLTLRIPNSLVRNSKVLEETADYIVEFLNQNNKFLHD